MGWLLPYTSEDLAVGATGDDVHCDLQALGGQSACLRVQFASSDEPACLTNAAHLGYGWCCEQYLQAVVGTQHV